MILNFSLGAANSEVLEISSLLWRAVMAFLFALGIGFLATPFWIHFLKRKKIEQAFRDKEEVHELADLHEAKAHTPTMGGVVIVLSTLISGAIFVKWNLLVGLTLLSFVSFAVLGFVDDFLKIFRKNSRGIVARKKILVQLSVALIFFLTLYMLQPKSCDFYTFKIPFSSWGVKIPAILSFVFLFFVLAGTSNAVNLTDGLDGLAAGCALPVLLFFSVVTFFSGDAALADIVRLQYIPGCGELAVLGAALLGACVVFLWYNGYPASIFMGDTGSLAIGGFMGSIAFLSNSPLHLVIAGGIFVVEALSVILQVGSYKFFNKRRIFKMAPLHHHFELGGLRETKVAMRFWIVSGLLSFLCLIDILF